MKHVRSAWWAWWLGLFALGCVQADTGSVETARPSRSAVVAALRDGAVYDELRAPVPYDRSDYSPGGWDDSDGDCQSDRHELLIAQSLAVVTLSADGCRVVAGLWVDRFDGRSYQHADQVTIDHLVALSAAHHGGAWAFDPESKRRFAHDILFAGAFSVVGAEMNQAKGDSGPHQWRPPLKSAWCSYGSDWVRVKVRWGLNFSTEEAAALTEMIATCTVVNTAAVELAAPTFAVLDPAPTPTPVAITAVSAEAVIGSCDARAETVVIENRGVTTADLAGWLLHDQHQNHSLKLDGLTIEPGQRLVIVTGNQPAPDHLNANVTKWKSDNVWNNSGDEATLVRPDTSAASVTSC